jgi:hypothetical protein
MKTTSRIDIHIGETMIAEAARRATVTFGPSVCDRTGRVQGHLQ